MLVTVRELMLTQEEVEVDMLGRAATHANEPVQATAKDAVGISRRICGQ